MKRVYLVCSLKEDVIMVFGTRKRAEYWIKQPLDKIYEKSKIDDLYIVPRCVF